MHCIGELMEPMAECSALRYGCSTPCRAAPTAAEIESRYREQILSAATSVTEPEEGEAAFVQELLARLTPEQLAEAKEKKGAGDLQALITGNDTWQVG